MAIAFALLASFGLGTSDFVGGLLSKRQPAWVIASASHLIAAVATASAAVVAGGTPRLSDLAWALGAGVGEGVGISFLFRGLADGRMGVVAPISGTGAALVPVAVGVATGEHLSPIAWAGITLAFPAVALISRSVSSDRAAGGAAGARHGIVAGLGFGAQLALVGQIGSRAGLYPLTLLWLGSATTVVAIAIATHQQRGARPFNLAGVSAVGLLSGAALVFYLLATRDGLLSIVSVIASLYPASTIAMAAVVLRERIAHAQAIGLALAASSVVMATIG